MNLPTLSEPFVKAFIDSKKPIIACIHGRAIGVAFTILGLCDYVYAVKNTKLNAPLVALAQGPEGCSSYLFPKYFGPKIANDLIVNNKEVTAEFCE